MRLISLLQATLFSSLLLVTRAQDQDNELLPFTTEFEGLRECPQGTDEEINECIRLLLNDIRPFLPKGIPKLGVPPLQPLRVKELNFQVPVVGLDYKWRNVVIQGASKYRELQVKIRPKRRAVDFIIAFDRVRVTANYYRSGDRLPIPLWGSGKVEVDLYNYRANGTLFLDVVWNDNGERKWDISDLEYDSSFDRIHTNIPTMKRNDVASRSWLAFVNKNAVWLYNSFVRPGVKHHMRNFFTKIELQWINTVLPLPKTPYSRIT